jgi:AcrR family transcriptional regulator
MSDGEGRPSVDGRCACRLLADTGATLKTTTRSKVPAKTTPLPAAGRFPNLSAWPDADRLPRHCRFGRYGGILRFSRGLFKESNVTAGMRQAEKTTRRPRADAVRNRERVLEAAKIVFSAGGPDASLEAVAHAAGVGIGTLYRHFPTREALFEAVYRREVQQLADLAEQLKKKAEPVEALRQWMRSNVRFVATKKGMSAALALAAYKNSELYSYSFDQLTRAARGLLDRAIAAGEIRSDVSPEDLLRALVGMSYMNDRPGWQTSVLRLIDVFIDGLRQPNSRRAKTRTTKSS